MATDWYRAVCDTHKEAIHVFLKPLHRTEYLFDRSWDADAWLSIHYGCELRLIWRDDQLDPLWDQGYVMMDAAFIHNEDHKSTKKPE